MKERNTTKKNMDMIWIKKRETPLLGEKELLLKK